MLPVLGPGDAEYRQRMSEEYFMRIVPKMFAHNGRQNIRFVKLLREAVLIKQYPAIADIFKNSGYADSTIYSRSFTLKKLPYFTKGVLNKFFYSEYYRYWAEFYDMKENMDVSVVDSGVLDEIEINAMYSYKDILGVLKNNANIKFMFPEDVVPSQLVYTDNAVQYVQFNHIGTNTSVPYPINFYYKCNRCGGVQRYDEIPKSKKCPLAECGGVLVRDVEKDLIARVYASQVAADGNYIPAISLVEIPNGEFTAATLVCRDVKNINYYVFILAVEEKKYESTQLEIRMNTHAVWQLIDIIDEIHESRMGFHIDGMDYYKAGILMSVIANAAKFTSYNVLIAGKSGGAKTATPKWYYNTVSMMCKLQDVVSVSMPGLVGASSVINVNNRNIQINEPGLLARNEFVVLDELYNKGDNRLISQLKVSLSSPTISKEVAGNRTEITKTACVTATANIESAVYNASRQRFKFYMDMYLASPESYIDTNDYTKAAMEYNLFDTDVSRIISRTVQYESAAEGLNWIDGQTFSDLDRFALLFYVGNPAVSDNLNVPDHVFDTVDLEISTPDLQRSIYSQNVREYIQYCSRIKVVIDDEMKKRAKELIRDVWVDDHIHSKARGMLYIKKTLELSAMLCGRDYLSDMDFDFVRGLFGKTCRWVEIDEMRRDGDDDNPGAHTHGRRDPVPNDIESFIDQRFKRYDLYGEGRSFWERGLVNISCDITTEFGIDDPAIVQKHIEEYIKRNAPDDANVFDMHTIPSDAPDVIEYFKKVKGGMDIGEFRELITKEFANKKKIPKSELEKLCAKCKVDVGVLNDQLGIMKRRGTVMSDGEFFRWIG